MNQHDDSAASYSVASSSSVELSSRIAAVAQLGATANTKNAVLLKALIGKTMSAAEVTWNWDPSAAQRVVELYAIAALHNLGDDSELRRIPSIVAAGVRTLSGPHDEKRSAATVVAMIGKVAVVGALIYGLHNLDLRASANVIGVLNTLRLPEAPTQQSLAKFAGAQLEVSGVTVSLRDFITLVVSTGRRSIDISAGVEAWIASDVSPSGRTELHQMQMSFLLQDILPGVNLDYFVSGRKVLICTLEESAARWSEWWTAYGPRMEYSTEARAFTIIGS